MKLLYESQRVQSRDDYQRLWQFPPTARSIVYGGNNGDKEFYFLHFPWMLFQIRCGFDFSGKICFSNLQIAFADTEVVSDKDKVYCPPLPNVTGATGLVCLGATAFRAKNVQTIEKQVINRFWKSRFYSGIIVSSNFINYATPSQYLLSVWRDNKALKPINPQAYMGVRDYFYLPTPLVTRV